MTHSERTKQRISAGLARYHERRREAARVRPRDLERLRRGEVAPALRPLLDVAGSEAAEIMNDLGGPDDVTAMQRALVEDIASTGLVLRSLLAAYVQAPDPELASKIGTLTSTRRASLSALGLSRRAREISPYQAVDVRFHGEEHARSDSTVESPVDRSAQSKGGGDE